MKAKKQADMIKRKRFTKKPPEEDAEYFGRHKNRAVGDTADEKMVYYEPKESVPEIAKTLSDEKTVQNARRRNTRHRPEVTMAAGLGQQPNRRDESLRQATATPSRKHLTKSSFRKRAKEDPEGFRKVYGPWTSLEATVNILRGVVPHFPFKEDGSDVLGNIPFGPLDSMEFVCGFAAECGYNFSQPLCDTFAAYMKQGSKKTVKELSDVVENAFNDEKIEQRDTFCDDGEHCRHFDIRDAFKEDEELCKEFGETHLGKQQCYMCRHWDNTHNGDPCDCTTGKCTWKWQDPNGKDQLTFWEEKS